MKRLIWQAIAVLTVFFPPSYAVPQSDSWEELFFQSNQAYQEERFSEAAEGYNLLIQSGHENGHIYYNLGNAYFRENDLGRTILNYERSRILMPRDADLNFNLNHAGDQTVDAIHQSQDAISMTFFWLKSLSLYELFHLFVILNIIFWAILLGRLFFNGEWIYYVFLTTLTFWLIGGISFGLKWYMAANDNRAVILEKEVSVMAGPYEGDTVLFKLHAGTIVRIERSEVGWNLIRLPDSKRGWLAADAVESIRKPDK